MSPETALPIIIQMPQAAPLGDGNQNSAPGQDKLRQNFRSLYERYQPLVYRFLIHKGLSPDEAREVTQDTFVTAYARIDTLREEAAFRPWLFSIACNLWRRHLEGKRNVVEMRPSDDAGPGDEELLASHDAGALDNMLDQERVRLVRDAIGELPPREQECLRAWSDEGLGYREIGQRMGINESTVGVHVHRGIKHLRERLKGYGDSGRNRHER